MSSPVPRVHLYCSTPNSPMRVEWILMEYVPHRRRADCWEEMGLQPRTRTARDLARSRAEMFTLTAPRCGVLVCGRSLNDFQRFLRYEPSPVDTPSEAHTKLVDGDFLIGPVKDVTFLTPMEIVPASLCGPVATASRQFGYMDACGGTK